MKTRVIISIIFIGLGLIIAAVPQNKTLPYKLSAAEMLELSNNRMHYYSPEEVANIIVQKDPEYQLIDIRPQDEYEKFTLPNAINIPFTDILSPEYRDILNQDVKRNILFANGTVDATKAWMIMSQLGWQNNYVMEGGLNYWGEVIMNPLPPANTSANEEIAKFQFRKAANAALSGETEAQADQQEVPVAKPPIIKRPQRKRVEGGC